MKTRTFAGIATTLAAAAAHGQTISPLLTNMQATSGPGTLIGTGGAARKAVRFSTGPQTPGVTFITLALDFTGGGKGVVSIWEGQTEPGQMLASGPIMGHGVPGTYGFGVPNVIGPNATYWVVVEPAPGSPGAFEWVGTSPPTLPVGAEVSGVAYFRDGQPDSVYNKIEAIYSCYANCDASTAAPVLNVADFSCFLQRFAAGHPYADCDRPVGGGCNGPCFNVADFTCFLQRFAAGCP